MMNKISTLSNATISILCANVDINSSFHSNTKHLRNSLINSHKLISIKRMYFFSHQTQPRKIVSPVTWEIKRDDTLLAFIFPNYYCRRVLFLSIFEHLRCQHSETIFHSTITWQFQLICIVFLFEIFRKSVDLLIAIVLIDERQILSWTIDERFCA